VGGRPHHQDGRQVQADRPVRLRCGADQSEFYYTLDNPDFPDSIPYKAQFVKPVTGVSGVSGEVRSKVKQIGVFIQDDWQVNDHLQLNLGLRWDYEKNPSYLDFVTPPEVVDAHLFAGSACRRWPDLRRFAGAERPEHQRLHQQRPQPQGIQECLAAAPGLLV
jgi:hypothetical protein